MNSYRSHGLPFLYKIEYKDGIRDLETEFRGKNRMLITSPPQYSREEIQIILTCLSPPISDNIKQMNLLKSLIRKLQENDKNSMTWKKYSEKLNKIDTRSTIKAEDANRIIELYNMLVRCNQNTPESLQSILSQFGRNYPDTSDIYSDSGYKKSDRRKDDRRKNSAEEDTLHKGIIIICNQEFPFVVEYGKRRRKVGLEIREGPKIVVTAPPGADKAEIYSILKMSEDWIAENYFLIKKAGPESKTRHSLTYKGVTYNYTVKYLKQARSSRIKVLEDNSIEVVVPSVAEKKDVESFVKENASFIHEQINREGRIPAKKIEFKDGEVILIKGKKVKIQTIQSDTKREPTLKKGILKITLPRNSEDDSQRLEWEISQFLRKFTFKEVNRYLPKYAKILGLSVPYVDIRYYKRCWGKCRPAKNQVIFNERLAMMPGDLIEYVVAHELCHFYYPNHGKGFYEILRKIMPDADEKKVRSKEYRIDLIR